MFSGRLFQHIVVSCPTSIPILNLIPFTYFPNHSLVLKPLSSPGSKNFQLVSQSLIRSPLLCRCLPWTNGYNPPGISWYCFIPAGHRDLGIPHIDYKTQALFSPLCGRIIAYLFELGSVLWWCLLLTPFVWTFVGWWWFLKDLNGIDALWWLLMVCNSLWWKVMVLDGWWWLMIGLDGWWCLRMVEDSIRWFWMASDIIVGYRWHCIACDGPGWLVMGLDC